MRFYILCPENFVTGGTELAHQLCYEIIQNGFYAAMYYIDRSHTSELPADAETPEKFRKYCDVHVTDFSEVDVDENVVVVPESLTDWAFCFKHARITVWWMSVDNFNFVDNLNYLKALDRITSYHLVQSEYAADYLRKKDIDEKKLYWLSDYIGDLYLQFIMPAQYRQNVILFNPKKGFDDLIPLIKKCTFVEWKALMNLTEEQMVLNMQLAKIYIDLGKHPGKDRIPREAVSCGCCILTNKKGSAAFFEDVPISDEYKFDEPLNYDLIEERIREIVDSYADHFKNFNSYRETVKSEKGFFKEDAKGFIRLFIN